MKLTDFSLGTLTGKVLDPAMLEGKVVLLVNVASQCGLTPQYRGLEALQKEFAGRGFTVLGFPCNQFAGQEPGDAEEIRNFCDMNYSITFPLGEKIEVNGPERAPLYAWLAGETAAFPGDITWNFEKFLIGRDGEVKARFSPRTTPEDPAIHASIESLL
ncbi:MAG: glutathione peroxidase [bacterium]|nr:glutathione peroxidase [bacterium]